MNTHKNEHVAIDTRIKNTAAANVKISAQQQMFEDFFTAPFNRTAFLGPQMQGHELNTYRYRLNGDFKSIQAIRAFEKYISSLVAGLSVQMSLRLSEDGIGSDKFDHPHRYFSLCVSTFDDQPEILFYAISHYVSGDDQVGLSFACDPALLLWNLHDFLRAYRIPENMVINGIDVIGDDVRETTRIIKSADAQLYEDFYPFIEEGVDELISGFYASRSNLLNLTGIWGSGKSTFMRGMINFNDGKFYLIDNPDIYANPDKFSKLVAHIGGDEGDGKTITLFLEECDAFVVEKSADNPVLSRLLSLSSGVLPSNIKIVIATNLANHTKLNAALLRPGRAYRSVNFSAQ